MIVPENVERYAREQTTPPGELLDRLAEETRATLASPEMLTGPVEARFLEFLVFATRPRRVLELGTYSGYSAISMARALPPGGRIDTCELLDEHAAVARRYLDEAGVADRVTVHVGPARETIERLEGPWDLVFLDADKGGYVDYYEAILPRLAEGGLLVADNTLFGGEVLADEPSDKGRAIAEFNRRVREDPRVVQVLLTVRDGVTLIRRA